MKKKDEMLEEYDFSKGKRGSVIPQKGKTRITIFIDTDILEWFRDEGNVSIPPPVILKMMLLLVLYNVRSERELMETTPMRLDWLWFLGYDIDSEVPDDSVLSKARARWGGEAFRRFFKRGYRIFFGLCGVDELKNGPKSALWLRLPSAIDH